MNSGYTALDGTDTGSAVNSLTRIRSCYPALPASEARVATWITQNPRRIVHLSMAQVAEACGVSDTTVLRFCKAAGFQGFTDLKLSIARDVSSPTQIIHDDIALGDSPAAIARKVFTANIQALYDTLEVLDEGALVRAIELLTTARRILIAGVGTSGPVVQSMYNMLLRLGLDCKAQTDSYLQLMEASLMGPGDVVIAISQSGTSIDPVLTLKQAHDNGAATICITGNAKSSITDHADVTLVSVDRAARVEAIASRLAQVSIADALYVIMALNGINSSTANEKRIWDALLPKML